MVERIQIIGSPVSPYVRKVLAILALKGIDFEIDPIVAFYADDNFTRLNPLRRIPVLVDGETVIVDSSVIAAYLDEKFPAPPILPVGPAERAKARWLEEFADTRMADIFLWKCFNAVILKPGVWGQERDLETYRATIEGPVADIMDYLESLAPEKAFVFGAFGLADIAVSVMFRNMRYARWAPDAARWPMTAGWIERCDAHPAFSKALAWSDAMISTPVPEQLELARKLGLPLTGRSLLTEKTPRRGPMTAV
ncbi:MAG TPA: glutathione S-transferase family protein [Parvularculaceae bacterium]|nr:glutathione S-transferase family protein [Parvularculaceae bacterium]